MGKPVQGAHYDVYLRTSRGTLRKRVATSKRSTGEAKLRAVADVQRVLKEPVEVLDCVPLKVVAKKAAPVVSGSRRRPVTTTKVEFKRTRRPKARESVRITPRGKLAPLHFERELVTDARAKVPSEKPLKRDAQACTNPNCIKRGHCGHKRKPGEERREWIIKTNRTRPVVSYGQVIGTERLTISAIAESEDAARKLARKGLHDAGIKGARFVSVSTRF